MYFTIDLHFKSYCLFFFTNRYERFLILYYYNVIDSFSSVGVADAGFSYI